MSRYIAREVAAIVLRVLDTLVLAEVALCRERLVTDRGAARYVAREEASLTARARAARDITREVAVAMRSAGSACAC